MKCHVCGKGTTEGVTLLRQNPKGEIGIWACERHNQNPIHNDELALFVAQLEDALQKPTKQ